jgi:glycine/D-amino acid oxidase-like deaminating enzyme
VKTGGFSLADMTPSIIKNNGVAPHLENRPASFGLLAEHFFQTFPTLTGLRFTHAWGGVIDTCSRYTAFWGKAYGGKVAYAVGYTGLGVGASRFGAQVMLDLLDAKRPNAPNCKW